MTTKQTALSYYRLTKPGIVYGNALVAVAGYFFGAQGAPSLAVFFAMLFGIAAVMASACVFNNIIDRDIDARMNRTKQRATVTGEVAPEQAILFGTILLVFGLTLLALGTNWLAAAIALFGHFAYVVMYGIGKRKTVHGTLIGTISGSTPPVIGYVAATGQLDLVAALLYLILVAWQMPHFYAIALFRKKDYAAAGIPVLPIVQGDAATRTQIITYVLLFIGSCALLTILAGASILWLLVMVLVGGYWLYLCLQPFLRHDAAQWARRQFGWSLNVLLVLSLMLSIDSFLH